jgi:hypothetical protein
MAPQAKQASKILPNIISPPRTAPKTVLGQFNYDGKRYGHQGAQTMS